MARSLPGLLLFIPKPPLRPEDPIQQFRNDPPTSQSGSEWIDHFHRDRSHMISIGLGPPQEPLFHPKWRRSFQDPSDRPPPFFRLYPNNVPSLPQCSPFVVIPLLSFRTLPLDVPNP